MITLLHARTSTAGAVLATVTACSTAALDAGWITLGGLATALFLTWRARRCYAQARRERAVEHRLERLGRDDERFVPPPPCCSFWRHTDRQVHGPDCTRPRAARTTLTPGEEREFARLVDVFHRPGSAA